MAKGTYFTKVQGLATVVWDGENDRALVEFDKQGLLMTKRPDVVSTLLEMGYQQVTAQQIKDAGMLLPEDFAAMRDRQPGRGYTGTATITPPEDEAGANGLGPTGPDSKGRALVQ
ncbi:hypothetical protein LCGC14_1291720 [marine sediment metagenome]|uniref:Uncharacterized protein n=1 Tax=marine sediment metagenome TaxID=412755 RepID=A0A0F9N8N2_9ZZZZ